MKGFTLIELLVVVLIIGILSAVALPQYEKAVLKSRAAGGLAKVKAFQTAQREYYLANGVFTTDLESLSLELDRSGWNCGSAQCQYYVSPRLAWEITFQNTYGSLNVYCLAANGDAAAQAVCGGYGQIGNTDVKYTYYYVENLSRV